MVWNPFFFFGTSAAVVCVYAIGQTAAAASRVCLCVYSLPSFFKLAACICRRPPTHADSDGLPPLPLIPRRRNPKQTTNQQAANNMRRPWAPGALLLLVLTALTGVALSEPTTTGAEHEAATPVVMPLRRAVRNRWFAKGDRLTHALTMIRPDNDDNQTGQAPALRPQRGRPQSFPAREGEEPQEGRRPCDEGRGGVERPCWGQLWLLHDDQARQPGASAVIRAYYWAGWITSWMVHPLWRSGTLLALFICSRSLHATGGGGHG
jgi:hypothetical protein